MNIKDLIQVHRECLQEGKIPEVKVNGVPFVIDFDPEDQTLTVIASWNLTRLDERGPVSEKYGAEGRWCFEYYSESSGNKFFREARRISPKFLVDVPKE